MTWVIYKGKKYIELGKQDIHNFVFVFLKYAGNNKLQSQFYFTE